MHYTPINTAKRYLLVIAFLLPILGNAAIVHVEMTVDSVSDDTYGTGVQVGDTLGYMEYDNTGLVRWDEWAPGLVDVTVLTDFSFNFLGNHYGLEDLSFSQIFLDDDYLYEKPFIFFSIDTNDFRMNWWGYSPDLYLFAGDDSNNSESYFQMDINVTAVPIPAAVWLFGSGLGLLGWFRRRRTA
jgi:hypothetical protein